MRILLGRRWWFASLLVLAAVAVMLRLGVWQLDRLEARRAFNARVLTQQNQPPLELDDAALGQDLYEMEYRQAIVVGTYYPQDEIVLRNQVWQGQLGVQLFTPLLIEGSRQAILVQRGWIPSAQADSAERGAFAQTGSLTVRGILRRAETDFGLRLVPDSTLAPGQPRLDAWNNLDLEAIAGQSTISLLPVYLQRIPEENEPSPPYAEPYALDLSEGPHFGYAMQWFLFAAVLALGYPFYVVRQEQERIKVE